MQIGCTQKLLAYLKREPVAIEDELDAFYSWSATLLTIRRRKTIAVVHEASRCGFVLYGVTAKQLKQMDQLLIEGIRRMLEAEGVVPEVLGEYLQSCGPTVRYTKTRNRSAVAHLNRFVQRVEQLADGFLNESLFQPQILLLLNSDIFSAGKEYAFTRELLRDGFAAHYPNRTVFLCPMVTLDVRLHLHSPCRRRIRVPLRQSLSDFHEMLQILFGWKDYHLHSFELEPDLPLDITMPEYASLASMDDWGMCDTEPMERWILLSEVLEHHPRFWYIYDMGDRWEHEITLVSQENMTAFSGPQCILALGDAPPEDVGGADGFAELQELLQHPEDPEYLAAKQWLEGTGWKPLDMEQLQNTLNWRSNLR